MTQSGYRLGIGLLPGWIYYQLQPSYILSALTTKDYSLYHVLLHSTVKPTTAYIYPLCLQKTSPLITSGMLCIVMFAHSVGAPRGPI